MDLWSNAGRSNAAGEDCEVRGQDRSQNTGRTAERKRNHLCGIAWTACRSHAETGKQRVPMKIVIGATGASGSIYLQRLLEQINASEHEVHLVMTVHARQVADHELMTFRLPPKVLQHHDNDMNVPYVSGSSRFDAMVIVPCSMSTLGRIASGSGETALLRAADVFLKERRKLIVVPRETPWSLIHARNVVTLLEAGAVVLPAIPSFYSRPQSVSDVVDTGVWRILAQIGLPNPRAFRWKDESTRNHKS